YNMKIA
ncbi:hypothetical protein CLOP_g22962, partial [Closterium sp. NIES-67]